MARKNKNRGKYYYRKESKEVSYWYIGPFWFRFHSCKTGWSLRLTKLVISYNNFVATNDTQRGWAISIPKPFVKYKWWAFNYQIELSDDYMRLNPEQVNLLYILKTRIKNALQ